MYVSKMTKNILIRKNLFDFWRFPVPFYDLAAKLSLVLLVFSIPLGEELTKQLTTALLVFYVLSGGFLSRYIILKRNPFFWASLGFFLIVLAGGLYGANNPVDIKRHILNYSPILFPVIFLPLLKEVAWRRLAFHAFMFAMLVTLIASWVHVVWDFPSARSAVEPTAGSHHIFKSHITQSVMMALFCLGCIAMAVQREKMTERFCLLVFALFAAVNILMLVGGRTGYMAISWVAMLSIYSLVPKRLRYYSIVLSAVVCASLFSFSDLFRDRITGVVDEINIYKKNDEITSSGARLKYWEESINLIYEKPWIGFGTGSWVREFCRVSNSDKWCHAWSTLHPHNQFLHFGVQYGLLGILILLAYFSVAIKMSLQFSDLDRLFLLGLLGILLLMSLVDVPFFIMDESRFFPAMLSIFFSGWAVSQHKRKGVFEDRALPLDSLLKPAAKSQVP